MKKQAGCSELIKTLAIYFFFIAMLVSPIACLISTLNAAPTPAHRAQVEAMPPNPQADWIVIFLAISICVICLLIAFGKRGTSVEIPILSGLGEDALDLAARTNLSTSIEMDEITPAQARFLNED